MISMIEYIWLDGAEPTKALRSKTRIVELKSNPPKITDIPHWGFDGSSTYQSTGCDSDLKLVPTCIHPDPIRGKGNHLVFCEVYNQDDTPHTSNTRNLLKKALNACQDGLDPWVGFEQEYTFFKKNIPLGWPEGGFPKAQGPYYCGVGNEEVFGRKIVEEHTKACIDAGIAIYGLNAEVMPGQWEFQIGYRGFENEVLTILDYSDQLWLARWLLIRIAEQHNTRVSFENKPIKGDWNGAGCHTNFSTSDMRSAKIGLQQIERAVSLLEKKHLEHITVYGAGLNERLTGQHETCSIDTFKSGISDRGASIRIPAHVHANQCGYLEDRRPGANCDPYLVSARLLITICEIDDDVLNSYFDSKKHVVSKAA